MGSSIGREFVLTVWGESHGRAIGAIVDGCPAGLPLSEEDIQRELDKRRPGTSDLYTSRREEDRVEILSGVFEGLTLGTPISMIIWNKDVDSSPYERIKNIPRPGHADLAYWLKYVHRDWRGGGRASGRVTAGYVMGGAVAKKLLSHCLNVEILGHVVRIGSVEIERERITLDDIRRAYENPVRCAQRDKVREMEEEIRRARDEGDSVGGIVEVIALNVPPGLGEPIFDKLEADLAKAVMSIPAIRGFEIGAGFELAGMRGSEANDPIVIKEDRIGLETNRAGGILGGISVGEPIVIRAVVKPTPSIAKPQRSVDLSSMREVELRVEGRHDPCICPRVLPVVEAMVAVVLVDHALISGLIPKDTLLKGE